METRSRSGSDTITAEPSAMTFSVPPLIDGGETGDVTAARSSSGMTSRGSVLSGPGASSNELQPLSKSPSVTPPNNPVCRIPMIRICSPHPLGPTTKHEDSRVARGALAESGRQNPGSVTK